MASAANYEPKGIHCIDFLRYIKIPMQSVASIEHNLAFFFFLHHKSCLSLESDQWIKLKMDRDLHASYCDHLSTSHYVNGIRSSGIVFPLALKQIYLERKRVRT
uniref:Uncharacterized protein n=1 Tax=Tetranychus urticae TaxID=32264 RepID=T1KX72_TETUR